MSHRHDEPLLANPFDPPSIPAAVVPTETPERSSRSRMVAVILGIFLGVLGAHNLYLGYRRNGVAQLLLWGSTLLFEGTTLGTLGVLALIVWVLAALARLVLRSGKFLLDGHGRPLR